MHKRSLEFFKIPHNTPSSLIHVWRCKDVSRSFLLIYISSSEVSFWVKLWLSPPPIQMKRHQTSQTQKLGLFFIVSKMGSQRHSKSPWTWTIQISMYSLDGFYAWTMPSTYVKVESPHHKKLRYHDTMMVKHERVASSQYYVILV